ncbi:MAG: motility protein A [Planctomycetes bacterium]|nr:motility protein A [Planctomycetota bacterium]
MDIATIIGYVLAGGFLIAGIGVSKVPGFIDLPSLLIVGGGASGAVIVSFPMEHIKKFVIVTKNAWLHTAQQPIEMIKRMVEFAEVARRDGILALENVTENVEDEFLVKGIQLAVDGTDPELIENIMMTELETMEERHGKGKALYEKLEKYAPAWGMIGTLIGLINMLGGGMEDPNALTSGMAVALITTMYGSICANLLFGPIADKLQMRNDEEILMKQIVLEGVKSIQAGDNPRIVEQKLRIYLPPSERQSDAEG